MEKLENKICLDSDFLIDFLRGKEEEIRFVKENEENYVFGTTKINLFELFYGAYKSLKRKENLEAISKLIDRVEIIDFSVDASKRAGKTLADLEEKGEIIDFRDILIGSIAVDNGFSIKTKNKQHFRKIEGLKVL